MVTYIITVKDEFENIADYNPAVNTRLDCSVFHNRYLFPPTTIIKFIEVIRILSDFTKIPTAFYRFPAPFKIHLPRG
jgi:hypothetical protein